MNKKYFLQFFIGFVFTCHAVSALSHGGDSSLIHACVSNKSGDVKIVGPDTDCDNRQSPLHWSIQGPPGPTDPVLLGRIDALEAQVLTLQQQVSGLVDSLAIPDIMISDVSLNEGAANNTSFVFTVSLSTISSDTVVADYSTTDGTADSATDYFAKAGQLVYLPGETSKTFSVAVAGDTMPELDETFFVQLSNVINANPTVATGTGTILNDDLPSVSVSGTADSIEGGVFTYNVSLSGPIPIEVSVDYSVIGDTAIVGSDLEDVSGTLVFAPGQTTAQVMVASIDDSLVEGYENFSFNLANPVNAVLGSSQVSSEIQDDDTRLSIQGANVVEGNTANSPFTIVQMTISLQAPASGPVSVHYGQAAGGTATPLNFFGNEGDVRVTSQYLSCVIDDPDQQLGCSLVSFAAGETEKTIDISVYGDIIVEGDENYFVGLAAPRGAVIDINLAEGIIIDDD